MPLGQHTSGFLLTDTVERAAMLCHHFRRGISNKNVDSCFIPETNVKSTVFQMRLGVLGRVIVDLSTIIQIKNVLKIKYSFSLDSLSNYPLSSDPHVSGICFWFINLKCTHFMGRMFMGSGDLGK